MNKKDLELGKKVLAVPMKENNDADAKTIKDYLVSLLRELWREGEGFSGKRPLGNSGWEMELESALVAYGLVEGDVDEYGWADNYDNHKARKLISLAIEALNE